MGSSKLAHKLNPNPTSSSTLARSNRKEERERERTVASELQKPRHTKRGIIAPKQNGEARASLVGTGF